MKRSRVSTHQTKGRLTNGFLHIKHPLDTYGVRVLQVL